MRLEVTFPRKLLNLRHYVVRRLTALAGGCTITSGTGHWLDPETGEVLRERVITITALAAKRDGLAKAVGEAGADIAVFARQFTQEKELLITLDNTPTFVNLRT